jgi:hypothetical protein
MGSPRLSKPSEGSDKVAPRVKPAIASRANTRQMTRFDKVRHGTAAGDEVG